MISDFGFQIFGGEWLREEVGQAPRLPGLIGRLAQCSGESPEQTAAGDVARATCCAVIPCPLRSVFWRRSRVARGKSEIRIADGAGAEAGCGKSEIRIADGVGAEAGGSNQKSEL